MGVTVPFFPLPGFLVDVLQIVIRVRQSDTHVTD